MVYPLCPCTCPCPCPCPCSCPWPELLLGLLVLLGEDPCWLTSGADPAGAPTGASGGKYWAEPAGEGEPYLALHAELSTGWLSHGSSGHHPVH